MYKRQEQELYQFGIRNGMILLLNVVTALVIGLLTAVSYTHLSYENRRRQNDIPQFSTERAKQENESINPYLPYMDLYSHFPVRYVLY